MIPKPPPRFNQAAPTVPSKPRLVTGYHQFTHYRLPMAGVVPAWVEVLRTIKYPTTVVVLDFESFFDSEYGMKDLSTIEYVTDKRFEVLGLAHLTIEGQYPFADYEKRTAFEIGEERVRAHINYLKGLYGPNLEGCTVLIQNARFDATVLRIHYNLIPKFIVDTLCLARNWNSRQRHGLEYLTKQLGLPAKGDTSEFSGVTLRIRWMKPKGRKKGPKMPVQMPLATEDQLTALSRYAQNDAARQWEAFTLLAPRVANPVIEYALMRHTLDLFLKPTLGVDFEHGEKLVALFQSELDQVVQATGHTSEEISGDKSFEKLMTEALVACGDDPQNYMKQMKRGPALAIAKSDDERELLATHYDPTVRALLAARSGQDSWPNHINRVQRIMAQARANGGLLCVPLNYYGGHTGRYSGGEKINLQNLSKTGLLAAIRQMLIAPEGHLLAVVDASAIEARVLAWVAGQWDLVTKFANNEEIYCGFAQKVLGYPVRKPLKSGGIPAIEARMLWARNSIGKIGVLGCGYGMGQDKLFGLGAGAFDMDMALKIRDVYRAENAAIVKFWADIERAFRYTATYHRPAVLERGIRFDNYEDCDVVMTLPNGREIHYLDVKVDRGGERGLEVYNQTTHSWEHIWGGTLTENCVQAISRDILVEAMLRCEESGIHTALTVHDELVAVVEETDAPEALNLMIKELSTTPAWAPRLPLGAEGHIMKAYSK